MNGGSVFRAVALVVLLIVLAGVGVSLYNAGVSAGVSQQLSQVVQDGQTVAVAPYPYGPYYHGGWGFGLGIFGIFFWIIGIFLIIGLIRAVFGWGRGGRNGGWGKGGPGYGRGGWYNGDRVADWHRELHRRENSADEERPDQPRPTSTI